MSEDRKLHMCFWLAPWP